MKSDYQLRHFLTGKFLVSLLLIFFAGCSLSTYDRFAFSVRDGVLYRGQNPFTILAAEDPGFGDPTVTLDEKSTKLNLLCSQGFNSIVVPFELTQVKGSEIDSNWINSFLTLITETRRRQMGVLLHVSLPETITNESQIKIANYLAESLSESWDVIFWMDKISNAQIFQEFTRRTDKLVTAGSGEADIVVTNSESKESKPILYRNVSDNTPRASNAHYLLSFDQNSIQFLNNFYQITPSSQSALKKSEFTPLFDGETFNGWTVTGDQSGWRINDHSFEWVKQGGGYLRTTRRYEDFILELEWKIEKGGNSGVFINAPLGGRASRIGMEIQIMGDYGESPHKNSSGAIYDVAAPLANPSRPEEEWNQMQIYSHGSNLQVRINNTLVQDHDLDQNPELKVRLRRGFIMLQDHGSPVSFRNIRIKEL